MSHLPDAFQDVVDRHVGAGAYDQPDAGESRLSWSPEGMTSAQHAAATPGFRSEKDIATAYTIGQSADAPEPDTSGGEGLGGELVADQSASDDGFDSSAGDDAGDISYEEFVNDLGGSPETWEAAQVISDVGAQHGLHDTESLLALHHDAERRYENFQNHLLQQGFTEAEIEQHQTKILETALQDAAEHIAGQVHGRRR